MGFTKLDESILQSSIMAAKPKTFKVWIALLAACESDGIARVSPTFLARVCYLGMKEVEQALEELSSPDPLSRTIEKDGRRIERVDGGFHIINYQKYREKGISEAYREKERLRWRLRKTPENSGDFRESSASASAYASVSEYASDERIEERKSEGKKEGKQEEEKLIGDIIAKWNTFAQEQGLAKVDFIRPGTTRYQKLKARLKEKEFDFDAILKEIEGSDFLKGASSNWRVSFDWIICPNNYPKVLEGQYRSKFYNSQEELEAWAKEENNDKQK